MGKLDVTEECGKAFKAHTQKTMKKGMQLIVKYFAACFKDAKSEKCKKAEQAIDTFEEEVEKECKKNGHLCTITAKDKDGTEEEDECIPKECHDETDKIKEFVEAAANHKDAKIEECKDFKCEVIFECPGDEAATTGDEAPTKVSKECEDALKKLEAEEKKNKGHTSEEGHDRKCEDGQMVVKLTNTKHGIDRKYSKCFPKDESSAKTSKKELKDYAKTIGSTAKV